jgi:hypothetical protein
MTMGLASQAARGVGSWAPAAYFGEGAFLAEEGVAVTVEGLVSGAFLGISGGVIAGAAWDATTANDYCPR